MLYVLRLKTLQGIQARRQACRTTHRVKGGTTQLAMHRSESFGSVFVDEGLPCRDVTEQNPVEVLMSHYRRTTVIRDE